MNNNKQTCIGRYELVRSIGRGAQGAVYLARDPALDRMVAVKVLTETDTTLSRKDDDGAPLEGKMSSKLKHPNIVPVFDAGTCDAGPYLVFEFVNGKTLAEVLKGKGPYSIKDAVPLFSGILDALAMAHSSEVLHLDLSPRNVLIDSDNGIPKVMDFGLAQYVSVAREPKEYATGTLRYMTPEHFVGKPLGPWTDVFALGSSFYEIVSGVRAMQGTALQEIQRNIIDVNVNFEIFRDDPNGDAFAKFIQGAMEQDRDGRYADCSAMRDAFDLFLSETGLADTASNATPTHSTVDFLLRRMRRTGDFPTISRTLSDINRLTGDGSDANADKLANVILRDFALTGKLLKLVNSAFYGVRATEITSISDAVVFLGIDKVRMTANSLAFFGQMKGDSAALKDSMTKSFLGGLISRHLAQRQKMPTAEEAFICGMCQSLGENLVIYYFADEFDDIRTLQHEKRLAPDAAARGVLGVTYADLGAAVAKSWNLPTAIVDSIRGVAPGKVSAPASEAERMRNIAVFSNELCSLFLNSGCDEIQPRISDLITRFQASVVMDEDYCTKLVAAGFEKLKQYAPIFEIRVASSEYCKSVQNWVNTQAELQTVESVV